MRKFLLAAGAVVLAAIVVGLIASLGSGVIGLPWMLLSALQGQGQGEQPTITWFTPTPTPPPTATPSPTRTPALPPGSTPTPALPTYTPQSTVYYIYYSAQPGDTLVSIAAMFGVEPEVILKANGLSPGSTVFPGLVLVIPNPRTTPRPAPAPTPTATSTPAP